MREHCPIPSAPRAYAETESARDPAFREAYETPTDEFAALAELLRASQTAGLTQADLAARIESSVGSRKHAPSLSPLCRYADACRQRRVIRFEPKGSGRA